jgi:hypothetical protein
VIYFKGLKAIPAHCKKRTCVESSSLSLCDREASGYDSIGGEFPRRWEHTAKHSKQLVFVVASCFGAAVVVAAV